MRRAPPRRLAPPARCRSARRRAPRHPSSRARPARPRLRRGPRRRGAARPRPCRRPERAAARCDERRGRPGRGALPRDDGARHERSRRGVRGGARRPGRTLVSAGAAACRGERPRRHRPIDGPRRRARRALSRRLRPRRHARRHGRREQATGGRGDPAPGRDDAAARPGDGRLPALPGGGEGLAAAARDRVRLAGPARAAGRALPRAERLPAGGAPPAEPRAEDARGLQGAEARPAPRPVRAAPPARRRLGGEGSGDLPGGGRRRAGARPADVHPPRCRGARLRRAASRG